MQTHNLGRSFSFSSYYYPVYRREARVPGERQSS